MCGVGSLALCALARKQKPWDWTRMAGPRRVGDGEEMKCNGFFCLEFNFPNRNISEQFCTVWMLDGENADVGAQRNSVSQSCRARWGPVRLAFR